MNAITFILQILATVVCTLAALVSIPLFFPFRWPAALMWGIKLFASALSPFLAFIGVFTMLVGMATNSLFLTVIGLYVTLVFFLHFVLVTRPPQKSNGFTQAFGVDWKTRIPADLAAHFLPRRTILRLPPVPEPRLEQNVSFFTIPGIERKLLCDVWQPPEGVQQTGVAMIFLHGSAFYFLDKDLGTRPLFRHLAAQGYVIMDVAYRLAPETDIGGMIHDAKRAIVWMKEHAALYAIDPSQIVVCGGSAGGHLALMAAYTARNPAFVSADLQNKDDSVKAVIAIYGANDLAALYYHTKQHLTTRSLPGKNKKAVPTKMPGWMVKAIGKDYDRLGLNKDFAQIGMIATLLGGHPDERPEPYLFFSPITHVTPDCPPTLLIHGAHDIMAPVASTRLLYRRLMAEKVPAVLHILPQTDHAFDLALPKIAPAAHNAIYDIERFLALQVERTVVKKSETRLQYQHNKIYR